MRWVYVWLIVCLLCAGMYAWADRYSMSSDGLSYLEIGSESLKSGPSNLVNGYWSPLYPALISLTFAILRPSLSAEIPAVHVTNLLIFAVVLLCFRFFLRSWIALCNASGHCEIYDLILFPFGIFLWFTVEFVHPSLETPDLSVTAIVFLSAAICCRACCLSLRWRHSLVLGAVLGLGYYAKAVMLPIGIILLAILFVLPPPGKRARLKVATSFLVFFIVTVPLVALISKRVGHLSTGETGPINYALYVNGLPAPPSWNPGSFDASRAESDHNGIPEHRIRTLLITPTILDFGAPIKGSNPLGYDPSYWFAGARSSFDLQQQWAAVRKNSRFYLRCLLRMGPLFSGALVFCLLDFPGSLTRRPNNSSVWLLVWPLATFGMYGLVHVEERFLTGFLILFWLALYALLWQRADQSTRTAVLWTVLFTLLVPAAVHIFKESAQSARDRPDYVLVGEALRTAGIHQGDSLAAVGGFDYEVGGRYIRVNSAFTAYYAHYIGARVVAAIVDPDDGIDMPQRPAPEFWHISAEGLTRVKTVLAGIDVKAIVALDKPADSTSADWKQVIGTRYSFLLLEAPDSAGLAASASSRSQ